MSSTSTSVDRLFDLKHVEDTLWPKKERIHLNAAHAGIIPHRRTWQPFIARDIDSSRHYLAFVHEKGVTIRGSRMETSSLMICSPRDGGRLERGEYDAYQELPSGIWVFFTKKSGMFVDKLLRDQDELPDIIKVKKDLEKKHPEIVSVKAQNTKGDYFLGFIPSKDTCLVWENSESVVKTDSLFLYDPNKKCLGDAPVSATLDGDIWKFEQ